MDVVTGGAGLLGAELIFQRLQQGEEITSLVRPSKTQTARERQLTAIAALHPEQPLSLAQQARLTVLSADLRFPQLGLGADTIAALQARQPRFFWHCAADLRHDARWERDIWSSNVEGVQRVADLALRLRVRRLHHVGTAYVSPQQNSVARELPLTPREAQTARNLYERSKVEGELVLQKTARVPYTIHRTTTLIGPGNNGYAAGTAAYFGFLRGLWQVREFVAATGQAVPSHGIPFRIRGSRSARINLIPVDTAARDMIALAERTDIASGSVFHIADGAPWSLAQHLALIGQCLGWSGLDWTTADAEELFPLERAFAELMADFQGQYFGDEVRYTMEAGGREPVASLSVSQMQAQIGSALAGFTQDQRGLNIAHYALRKRISK